MTMDNEIKAAVDTLRVYLRTSDVETLRDAFRHLHRTEKQNVVRNIVHLLDEAAIDYDNKDYDARNEASAKWAYAAREGTARGLSVFPYI